MTSQTKSWMRLAGFCVIVAGCGFMLGFFNQYYLPKIESWLLIEIEGQSQKHLPVRVWPGKVEVDFFPPRVVVRDIRLLPKPPVSNYLAPSEIRAVSITLSWLSLLKGQVRIAEVAVERPQFSFIQRSSEVGSTPFKVPFTIKQIQGIPIDSLALNDVQLLGRMEDTGVDLKINGGRLLLENRFRSLYLEVEVPKMAIKERGQDVALQLDFETRLLADENQIQLSSLKLVKDRSYILINGRTQTRIQDQAIGPTQAELRSQLFLSDMTRLAKALRPDLQLPDLSGLIQIQALANLSKPGWPEINFKLVTENLKIDRYLLGNVRSQGNYSHPVLTSESIGLTNTAMTAELRDFRAQLTHPMELSTTVNVRELELKSLFKNLGLKEIPVDFVGSAELPCQGRWQDTPELKCQGKIAARNLAVHLEENGRLEKRLLEVDELRAKGDFVLNSLGIKYRSELEVGQLSRGKSDGEIDFKKGFQIQYEASQLNFSDVRSLAELKIEGAAQLKGTTKGDSKKATMKLDLKAQNAWFENFALGTLDTELNYKEGVFNLRNLQGRMGDSRYTGNLSINFPKRQIFVTGRFPYAELADLRRIFEREYLLPIEISGSGSADIKVWGPLDPRQLNFRLISSFFRGRAATETFDEFYFNAKADNGNISADRIQIIKATSGANLTGQISSSGIADLIIVGRGLRIEQSEAVQAAGLDILGQADFTMSLKGPLKSLNTELHGRLSRVVIGDKPFDDSNFQMKFGADQLHGKGRFLGQLLTTDFIIPYSPQAPFRLDLETRAIDVTNLFTVFSANARRRDFDSSLSLKARLESSSGGIWTSDGQIEIKDFSIRRGPLDMKLTKQGVLRFSKGLVNSDGLDLVGENSFLNLKIKDSTLDRLDASLNAKLEMNLLSIFTPFLSDLRGRLAAAIEIKGTMRAPALNGSLFVEEGVIKLNDFPHAFEAIKADILLNQTSMNLNALRAELGGGQVTGDGSIILAAKDSVPIDIRGRFKDVNLNVPEGMKSKGSGVFSVKGLKAPYVLGLKYEIESGEVTKEFTDNSAPGAIKPSAFLPKFVKAESVSPINFDFDIQLVNPVPVRNSLVQSPVKGRLLVVGPPQDLRLTGTLNPQPGGKVIFRDTYFDILSAFVEWDRDPPAAPRVFLSSQSRVQETLIDKDNKETVNEYDIGLLVQGRVSNLQIGLTSQPPLSETEIVSLLALGMTSANLQAQSEKGQQGANSGIQIGTALFQRAAGSRVKDKTGVDVQVGSETEANVTSPKVTLSKQITKKLGASASRTIDNNPKNNVKLEYKVNRNFSVIGSWESRESQTQDVRTDTESTSNKLGVDLEYKINFK